MKAVIMAGGRGSRLRPLTCELPKPMVPILNYPVMEHIIKLLKREGISEIAVTTYYLPQVIKDYFGDGSKWGVNLHYYQEESPLGTAGSVHNADDFLDETFVVVSGDAITDFNLQEAVRYHQNKRSEATLVLSREEIPLEYGVVMTNREGRIVRFLEKPNWGQVFSDTINTGIYVLEPSIFKYYKKGVKFDFSKDLFPLMLEKGNRLYGVTAEGYWNDIGNLKEYRSTHYDFLDGKINLPFDNYYQPAPGIWIEDNVEIDPTASLKPPVYLGEGSKIGRGVILSSAVVGRDTLIGPYTSIKNTIIWNNGNIGPNCEIRESIMGDNVVLREKVNVYDHTALGHKVRVNQESIIKPGVKIWPERTVDSGSVVEKSIIQTTRWSKQLFTERGIIGEGNIDITAEFVCRLASAYTSTFSGKAEVTVSSDGHNITRALKRAVSGGLQAAGLNVVDLGKTVIPVVRHTIPALNCQGGIHLRKIDDQTDNIIIEFYNQNGVNISAGKQKSIEKKYFAEDFNRSLVDSGKYTYLHSMEKDYITALFNEIETEIIKSKYFRLVVKSDRDIARISSTMFQRLNCQVVSLSKYPDHLLQNNKEETINNMRSMIDNKNAELGLIFTKNGEGIHLIDERGNLLDRIKFQLLISIIMLEKGVKKLFLPINSPRIIEKIARDYNAEVVYTPTSYQVPMQRHYQYLEEVNEFESPYFQHFHDAFYGLGLILEKIAREETTLARIVDSLPEFYLNKAEFPCNWREKGRVIKSLAEKSGEDSDLIDGVRFNHENGWALIIPDSEKPMFHIFAEGDDMETAESLTGFYLKEIQETIKKEN